MLKYLCKRVAFMLLTLLIILSICFLLIRLLPNEDVTMFGKDMELVAMNRYRQGLTDIHGNPIPLIRQYGNFLVRTLLGGNWGTSEKLYYGQDCLQVFVSKLPATVLVNAYASLLAVPLGLLLGIYAALKKNRWQDHLISTLVVLFISVPSYVYAFLVQYFLCYRTGLFPLTAASRQEVALWSLPMLRSMFPAVLSLAFGTIAALTRFTRAELSDAMTGEYMLLARTKGLSRPQLIARHAFKNAMVPILPMILGEFVGILGGSLIIEGIFSIPGVGSLYTTAITVRDYNFFMALTFFYTLIGLASSLMVDISYALTDPRIQIGEK